MKPNIGDTFWYVPLHRGTPHVVTVTRVGRKYFQVEGERVREFEIDTGREKSSYPSGKLYASQEDYEAHKALQATWNRLRREVESTYYRPAHLSIADMRNIAAVLGVNLE